MARGFLYRLAAGVGAPCAAFIPRLGYGDRAKARDRSGLAAGATRANQVPPEPHRSSEPGASCLYETGYIVQYEAPSCQLGDAVTGDSPQKSTPKLDLIRVPGPHQWISTTAGRIATDPYSWMQAVHWIGGSGLYTPSRTHGPKWGETTLRLAQELSALTECRPGIAYLSRKLRASERTVQYHLGMLREAGLLAYRYKGSRITGSIRQASVYERIIPAEFDAALGIRTVGEGVQRRPVGIAAEHRSTIGTLAKKAARKVRRKRSKKASSGRGRCTPMQGGTSTSSTAGGTHSPSESKLASGQDDSPPRRSPSAPSGP